MWDRERRISLISMLPTDARFKERGIKLRGIMKKTGPLFDPPVEYLEIPFEGTVLPGYFRKAAAGKTPAKVTVPALVIVGEGEYRSAEVQRHQKVAMDGFTNPKKKMVITPSNEGATNHCVMENRSIVGQVLFDWLDDVFK